MKDYKTIVAEIVDATENIKDEKLKEIAFQKLLEHSLEPNSSSVSKKVESMDTGNFSKKLGVKKRSKSSVVRDKVVREEVKSAFNDVSPNMPGLKPLGSLKQKWEKYIWALVVAKEKGIEMMTNNEIAFVLSEKFSVGVTEKTVNNLTFKVESGFVQKRDLEGTRAWKVLIDGINSIKEESTTK
ncbi:hypothetical protein A2397_01320 [Candidatus Amesbacteria bacterium RIFOXYB1_FULL_44_23]|uniref:Uncharacterized protein n=1 Tax=Candidatus Amesbacteria bacterium RIFOXYB1_FULL_44_23 TaxID=1797263 RepID=A0A1F4ZYP9_9BACT|nr:MAG: hypothetical protein A2397_01320 [Candidatus Amesbacteria bacterium RIFOXYB1_FULL_44_23]